MYINISKIVACASRRSISCSGTPVTGSLGHYDERDDGPANNHWVISGMASEQDSLPHPYPVQQSEAISNVLANNQNKELHTIMYPIIDMTTCAEDEMIMMLITLGRRTAYT